MYRCERLLSSYSTTRQTALATGVENPARGTSATKPLLAALRASTAASAAPHSSVGSCCACWWARPSSSRGSRSPPPARSLERRTSHVCGAMTMLANTLAAMAFSGAARIPASAPVVRIKPPGVRLKHNISFSGWMLAQSMRVAQIGRQTDTTTYKNIMELLVDGAPACAAAPL
jgi:hypothetical protein